MTRADNAIAALGRSRDTLVGAAPLPPAAAPIIPRSRVELRLWALTPAGLAAAADAVHLSPGSRLWDVCEVVPSSGGECPIRPGDPLALGQGADYGYAWAAYLVRDRG